MLLGVASGASAVVGAVALLSPAYSTQRLYSRELAAGATVGALAGVTADFAQERISIEAGRGARSRAVEDSPGERGTGSRIARATRLKRDRPAHPWAGPLAGVPSPEPWSGKREG